MNEFSTALAERAGQSDPRHRAPEVQQKRLAIDLPYRRVRNVVWTASLLIIALCTMRQAWVYWFGLGSALGTMPLIDFDGESSLPTWWSVLLLALAAVLVASNGVAEPSRRWKPYWFGLAAIFLFLSLDEGVTIHERLMGFLSPLRVVDFLNYPWIIPYAIACLVIGTIYARFVFALPRAVRPRIIFAGCLYITSALVLEAVGAHCTANQYALCRSLEFVAEESGEIVAVVIFILALLTLLRSRYRTVALEL